MWMAGVRDLNEGGGSGNGKKGWMLKTWKIVHQNPWRLINSGVWVGGEGTNDLNFNTGCPERWWPIDRNKRVGMGAMPMEEISFFGYSATEPLSLSVNFSSRWDSASHYRQFIGHILSLVLVNYGMWPKLRHYLIFKPGACNTNQQGLFRLRARLCHSVPYYGGARVLGPFSVLPHLPWFLVIFSWFSSLPSNSWVAQLPFSKFLLYSSSQNRFRFLASNSPDQYKVYLNDVTSSFQEPWISLLPLDELCCASAANCQGITASC